MSFVYEYDNYLVLTGFN